MATQIDLANAMVAAIQAAHPEFNVRTNYELSVSGVIANSTSNGTYSNCTVTDPQGGTLYPTNTPESNWIVIWDQNIASTTSVAADARIQWTKGGDRKYAVTPSLLQNLTTSQTRPGIGVMAFEPKSSFTAQQTPVSTTGTVGPYTNTFNVEAIYLSNSFSNIGVL